MPLPVLKLDENAIIPQRSHPEDAGLDLYALEDTFLFNPAIYQSNDLLHSPYPSYPIQFNVVKVRTGIAIALPRETVGIIHDRSSMGLKGIKVMGGVIDSNYRGEIVVCLVNLGEKYQIKRGDRIAQLIITPIRLLSTVIVTKEDFEMTSRSSNGFGSTGV